MKKTKKKKEEIRRLPPQHKAARAEGDNRSKERRGRSEARNRLGGEEVGPSSDGSSVRPASHAIWPLAASADENNFGHF